MREFKNDISYNQLITFRAIFEARSISQASKLLAVSPATVSHSLKMLEKQIGQVLFLRTTRSITATELACELYSKIHFAIDDLSLAVDRACEANNTPSGTLSLNMAHSIYQWFLKQALADFQHQHPQIQLDLTLSDTLDSRVEKQIDVGFRYGDRVEESLIARPIKPLLGAELPVLRAALFVSAQYAKSHGVPESLEQLKGHKLVKFRMPSSQKLAPLRLHKTPQANSEIVSFDLATAMVVNDMEAVVDMVSQGLGMGMMVDALLSESFASGELVPVLEQHWCEIPKVHMYYAPESKQSLKCAVLSILLLSGFPNLAFERCLEVITTNKKALKNQGFFDEAIR